MIRSLIFVDIISIEMHIEYQFVYKNEVFIKSVQYTMYSIAYKKKKSELMSVLKTQVMNKKTMIKYINMKYIPFK